MACIHWLLAYTVFTNVQGGGELINIDNCSAAEKSFSENESDEVFLGKKQNKHI